MDSLSSKQIASAREALAEGATIRRALPVSLGGAGTASGLWRFFSEGCPNGGVERWNEEWCRAWSIPLETCFCFGEDVFGNQLVLIPDSSTIYLCDHENGACHDLELGLGDLLESVLAHGLDWIDFYSNGSLDIARGFLAGIGWEQHLHWTHPVVLGGSIAVENVSIVDRLPHVTGHASLWRQISGLPPGTETVI